jgi:flagellin
MSSILTNGAAMTALQTLRSVNANLSKTQAAVSSGLRVGSASDNAAYWSIATTMRSDNSANSAISDALGLGAATADTAYQGMNSAIDLVKQIESKLVAAQADGVDQSKVQGELTQLQGQLQSITDAASFNGENWLSGNPAATVTKSVLGSFVRDTSGDVSVKTIDYDLDGSSILIDSNGGNLGILDKTYNVTQDSVALDVNSNGTHTEYTVPTTSLDDLTSAGGTFSGNYANVSSGSALDGDYVKVASGSWVKAVDVTATKQDVVASSGGISWGVDTAATVSANAAPSSLLAMDITSSSKAQIGQMMKAVDAAMQDMNKAAAKLGSIVSRIDLQTSFVSKLTDSIDSGIGKLVDADMEAESSKLTALQTQQQLAVQSLSIANSSSQSILTLFRS